MANMSDPSSHFSLPSPPFLKIEGVPNFRDIGGYAVSAPEASANENNPTSLSVRQKFLFRSGTLTHLTSRGAETLVDDLGVRTIYDLRSVTQTAKQPTPPALLANNNVQIDPNPVFPMTELSPERLVARYRQYMSDSGSDGFVAAYSEILRSGRAAFRRVFEHVRDRPQEPLLFHCAAGKDRTGVLAALLLLTAGVAEDVVAREYALTDVGLGEKLKEPYIKSLLKDPNFANDRPGVERMLSAKESYMAATIKWLEKEYGGVQGYLRKALELREDDIAKIRKSLVGREAPVL